LDDDRHLEPEEHKYHRIMAKQLHVSQTYQVLKGDRPITRIDQTVLYNRARYTLPDNFTNKREEALRAECPALSADEANAVEERFHECPSIA